LYFLIFGNKIHEKKCIKCSSNHVQKHGKNRNGTQRYKCLDCGKTFTNKKRNRSKHLLSKYLLDKQIYRVLMKQGLKYRDVQKSIDHLDFCYPTLVPRSCVVAIDTTYFSRNFGITIFRDVTNNVILHWIFVERENTKTHAKGIRYLEQNGITIVGFVVDGFWGFYVQNHHSYDIQMCQKHMADIVRKYVTRNPKLQASRDLKEIIDKLSCISEKTFNLKFDLWLTNWTEFLKEKTVIEGGNNWFYTHGRVRSAVTSLVKYKDFLFTFERNHWLPNTNNSIEGFNSGLKSVIRVHRGLRRDRKVKLIHFYLKEKSAFKWG